VKYFGEALSEKHKQLGKIIRKKDTLEEAKGLFLEIHAALNMPEVSGCEANDVNTLFEDLSPREFAVIPKKGDKTIAYAVWHLARIEDMTMNILVDNSGQIFDRQWQDRLNVTITDTGNAMTDDEIMTFSKNVNTFELLAYRNAAAGRTREIVKNLMKAEDMRRKVSREGLDKIRREGGVAKDAEWLLNYWGSKDVAGLLLRPPTRHVIMHLNDCCKWKLDIRTKKNFYME
jgi:hypothetical protein